MEYTRYIPGISQTYDTMQIPDELQGTPSSADIIATGNLNELARVCCSRAEAVTWQGAASLFPYHILRYDTLALVESAPRLRVADAAALPRADGDSDAQAPPGLDRPGSERRAQPEERGRVIDSEMCSSCAQSALNLRLKIARKHIR